MDAEGSQTVQSELQRHGGCAAGEPSREPGRSFGLVSADVWSLAQGCLVVRELLCMALVARSGLALLHGAVHTVKAALFSVGASASSWEGSCADWDRRAGDAGEWPLELRGHEAFLYQQAAGTLVAEIGFNEDAQGELLGRGVVHLRAAVRAALPRCLGPAVCVEVDAIRNVSAVSPAVTATLQEAQPRVLGVEGLAADELGEWTACISRMAHTRVLVHAWTDNDIVDAHAFFAALLKALPLDVRALDFQNLACQLQDLPVGLLPSSCLAFGTIVLQRDVNGCCARGSMAFADFQSCFPTFPQQVAIVRASLGTEGRWAHSAQAIADAFCCKFPGIAVLQLELSLKTSASINDVPFVDLARTLIGHKHPLSRSAV